MPRSSLDLVLRDLGPGTPVKGSSAASDLLTSDPAQRGLACLLGAPIYLELWGTHSGPGEERAPQGNWQPRTHRLQPLGV